MDKKMILQRTKWPESADAATAEAMILHSARLSMAIRAQTDQLMQAAFDLPLDDPNRRPALRAYLDAMTSMIAESQVAILLVEVQKASTAQADALARLLYELTEDGGVLPELMFDYLTDRGLDAELMWEIAQDDALGKPDSACSFCGERRDDLTRGSDGSTSACRDCLAEADSGSAAS